MFAEEVSDLLVGAIVVFSYNLHQSHVAARTPDLIQVLSASLGLLLPERERQTDTERESERQTDRQTEHQGQRFDSLKTHILILI